MDDIQELLLEEWYWHTLYLHSWTEAVKAQQKIEQALDPYCDLGPMPTPDGRYAVTFSTNYRFEAEHQQSLIELVGSQVDFETEYNQPDEDTEDLLKVFRWSEPEQLDGVNTKIRVRITDGLCTICGTRPRASYGLWCSACKRAYLKGFTDESLDEELDLIERETMLPLSPSDIQFAFRFTCTWFCICVMCFTLFPVSVYCIVQMLISTAFVAYEIERSVLVASNQSTDRCSSCRTCPMDIEQHAAKQ